MGEWVEKKYCYNSTTCLEEHVQHQQPGWTSFVVFALPQQKSWIQCQFHCFHVKKLCSSIQGKTLTREKAASRYTSGWLFQIWPSGLTVQLTCSLIENR